ncbi:MAG TPA: OsmC family protein [Acetobacteraceae bacterium]|nr:OsmC family protein [Acetobacteraceae bacterium]
MSESPTPAINGVDVGKLLGTVAAITAAPGLADFRFRVETDWKNGGHSQTRIQGFHGADSEDTSRFAPFVLEGDEPPVLLGANAGPNAVEMVLTGLASCLAVGFAYNAAARGIRIEALNLRLEGEIDLHGFLGLSYTVRPGYRNIRVTCRLRSDATREQLLALSEHVQKTSPVLDIIRNPVPVAITIET